MKKIVNHRGHREHRGKDRVKSFLGVIKLKVKRN